MPFIWLLSVGRDEKIIKIYRQRYNSTAREWMVAAEKEVGITQFGINSIGGSRCVVIKRLVQHPSQPSASLPLRSFIFSHKLEMSSSENSEALVLSSDPLHVRSAKFR
jgi:hypothetical protein